MTQSKPYSRTSAEGMSLVLGRSLTMFSRSPVAHPVTTVWTVAYLAGIHARRWTRKYFGRLGNG